MIGETRGIGVMLPDFQVTFVVGVRLENGKYPTLSLFFVQIASRVYGDS
ncbi:hypothetical protein [Citrobacter werkmanii]|nr:hypothetical protein [Citrobacter werkmanii]